MAQQFKLELVNRSSELAGEGARTLDLNLGKVALYQLSYSRAKQKRDYKGSRHSVKQPTMSLYENAADYAEAALPATVAFILMETLMKLRTLLDQRPGAAQVINHGPKGKHGSDV